jgi:O-antigen/teichoic acid export membrane protein
MSSLGTALLSTLVIGIAYPVYLHFLGYEQYGLWLVLSTVLIMAQLGNLGLSPALLKLVAEDFAAGDVDGVYKYISCGVLSLALSGIVLMCGVLLLRRPLIAIFGIGGPNAEMAYILLPYVGILSVYVLMADALNSVVAGLGRYDLVGYSQLTGQFLTVVGAVVLFKLHCGVWSLLIANAASALFLNVLSLVLIRRITHSGSWLRFTWDRQRFRRILNFGFWVFGSSILYTAFNPLNKLFVTRFAGIAAVPIYDISFATSFKIRSFFESGFRSLTPEFSRLNAVRPQEAQDRLASADRKGLKVVLYAGTLLYLVVFLFCGWGLQVWLRGRFRPELPSVFRIMLLGSYLSLWGVQPWYSLLGFGRSAHILVANLVMVVSNICFVLAWPLLLTRPATLTTVTIGTAVGILVSTLYLRWQGARLRKDLATQAPQVTRLAHQVRFPAPRSPCTAPQTNPPTAYRTSSHPDS